MGFPGTAIATERARSRCAAFTPRPAACRSVSASVLSRGPVPTSTTREAGSFPWVWRTKVWSAFPRNPSSVAARTSWPASAWLTSATAPLGREASSAKRTRTSARVPAGAPEARANRVGELSGMGSQSPSRRRREPASLPAS